eukprot:COSAG01_NODE_23916_length_797_cov_1.141834_2_plen_165_part_01
MAIGHQRRKLLTIGSSIRKFISCTADNSNHKPLRRYGMSVFQIIVQGVVRTIEGCAPANLEQPMYVDEIRWEGSDDLFHPSLSDGRQKQSEDVSSRMNIREIGSVSSLAANPGGYHSGKGNVRTWARRASARSWSLEYFKGAGIVSYIYIVQNKMGKKKALVKE